MAAGVPLVTFVTAVRVPFQVFDAKGDDFRTPKPVGVADQLHHEIAKVARRLRLQRGFR
jgi:hypothetical protein